MNWADAETVTMRVTMPEFALGADVHANVFALRKALGSVADALSAAKLADLITEQHSARKISASQVQRWEAGVEPDLESVRIMAGLAGVPFEVFAIGEPAKQARPETRGAKMSDGGIPTKQPNDKRKRA